MNFFKKWPVKTLKKLALNTHLAWVDKKSDILNQSHIPILNYDWRRFAV